jgi:outer membrane protein OmpA-like peptidoglycan-associated protein
MKKLILKLFLFCCLGSAHAQHEVWLHGGGGMEADGYSWLSGLGYRYFFVPRWSLGVSAEIAYVNQDFSSSSKKIDEIENEEFVFRTKTKTSVYMLQLPLMAQYHVGDFFLAMGSKASFPLSGDETVKKSGYYEFEDYEYTEQEFLGFGTSANKVKGALFFIALEAGHKWKLAKDISLYASAYLDHGKYTIIGAKIALAFGNNGKEARALRKAEEVPLSLEKKLEELNAMYLEAAREHSATGFSISQTKLGDIQREDLDRKIELLQSYPNSKFYIYGHTCNLGSQETNEKTGLERAKNAKDYMISKGIDESRIIGIGSKLDTEPLLPNTSEENRAVNRRVEIVLEKEGK